MVSRYCTWRGVRLTESTRGAFDDQEDISFWAREAVSRCQGSGLIQGKGENRFSPQDHITRAELAQLLLRLEAIGAMVG